MMRHLPIAVLALLLLVPDTSLGEVSDKFAARAALLDGRASQQYLDSERLRPKAPAATIMPKPYAGAYRGPYLQMVRAAARRHGIPEDLFLRLVQQESGFNPSAVSIKGAIGLAQLMPGTASALGVDPWDPEANLDGGARYLAQMKTRFGTWKLALAGYNAGPEAVARHEGVPPYEETLAYVQAIWGS